MHRKLPILAVSLVWIVVGCELDADSGSPGDAGSDAQGHADGDADGDGDGDADADGDSDADADSDGDGDADGDSDTDTNTDGDTDTDTDTDSDCDDGTEPLCKMAQPECTEHEILAVQDSCWICVNPATCKPWGEAGCKSSVDCEPGHVCDFCGTSSCPMCDDCLAACLPKG